MEYDDDHGCGLKFLNINAEHFGWWSCHMDDENESDYHKGTFKINDVNDYPKDIRLPSDMKVRRVYIYFSMYLGGIQYSHTLNWGFFKGDRYWAF